MSYVIDKQIGKLRPASDRPSSLLAKPVLKLPLSTSSGVVKSDRVEPKLHGKFDANGIMKLAGK
jgi:hypothetical protein